MLCDRPLISGRGLVRWFFSFHRNLETVRCWGRLEFTKIDRIVQCNDRLVPVPPRATVSVNIAHERKCMEEGAKVGHC